MSNTFPFVLPGGAGFRAWKGESGIQRHWTRTTVWSTTPEGKLKEKSTDVLQESHSTTIEVLDDGKMVVGTHHLILEHRRVFQDGKTVTRTQTYAAQPDDCVVISDEEVTLRHAGDGMTLAHRKSATEVSLLNLHVNEVSIVYTTQEESNIHENGEAITRVQTRIPRANKTISLITTDIQQSPLENGTWKEQQMTVTTLLSRRNEVLSTSAKSGFIRTFHTDGSSVEEHHSYEE